MGTKVALSQLPQPPATCISNSEIRRLEPTLSPGQSTRAPFLIAKKTHIANSRFSRANPLAARFPAPGARHPEPVRTSDGVRELLFPCIRAGWRVLAVFARVRVFLEFRSRSCGEIRKEKEKAVGSRSLTDVRKRRDRVWDDSLGQRRKRREKTKAAGLKAAATCAREPARFPGGAGCGAFVGRVWDYNSAEQRFEGGGDASGSRGRFVGQGQVELGGAHCGGRRSDPAALQDGQGRGRGGAAVGGAENRSGRRLRIGPCRHQHSTIGKNARREQRVPACPAGRPHAAQNAGALAFVAAGFTPAIFAFEFSVSIFHSRESNRQRLAPVKSAATTPGVTPIAELTSCTPLVLTDRGVSGAIHARIECGRCLGGGALKARVCEGAWNGVCTAAMVFARQIEASSRGG